MGGGRWMKGRLRRGGSRRGVDFLIGIGGFLKKEGLVF